MKRRLRPWLLSAVCCCAGCGIGTMDRPDSGGSDDLDAASEDDDAPGIDDGGTSETETGSNSDDGSSDDGNSDDGSNPYQPTHHLLVGEKITTDQYLLSLNALYRFTLQGDGDLVLRDVQAGQALWASDTKGKSGTELVLQGDGNLVLYTASGSPVWDTKTVGSNATELRLHDDGSLVLYQGTRVVWQVNSSNVPNSGKILNKMGSFPWDGAQVHYRSAGGLTTTGGLKPTSAKTGDFEIVSFGASHGGGDGNANVHFDETKMLNQGFKPINVRGTDDRKDEMWVRKNSGQTQIDVPSLAVAYDFLVLDGSDIQIDLDNVLFANNFTSGTSYQVPNSGGSGLRVLTYFSDDSVELTDFGNGILVFQEWGFGDGDGYAVVLYPPSVPPPSSIAIINHDSGGRQYVGIMATFGKP